MKNIIAIIAVSSTLCANAKLTKNSAESEFRAVAESVLAATNAETAATIAYRENLWAAAHNDNLARFCAEYDERIADKCRGVKLPCWAFKAWPKVAEFGCAIQKVAERNPYIYSKAKELNVEIFTPAKVAQVGGIEIAANILAEMISKRNDYYGFLCIDSFAAVKTYIQKDAVKIVKKWLRRQGKSFVTKDGINPCADKMEDLNVALNAPRLMGLNQWFADMGVQCTIDISTLPTPSEIESIKSAVLEGETDLTDSIKIDLYLCLGVDGYNQFVRAYNGE